MQFKKVFHLDEKVITPSDKIGSNPFKSDNSLVSATDPDSGLGPRSSKSVIGRPKIYDLKGNLLASEENLVVMVGREYLAQLVAGVQGQAPNDYTTYKITHFGVGNGGASNACPPTTVGPFDDDVDLENRVQISTSSDVNNFPDGGKLKRITIDGEIDVVSEQHTINVPSGGQLVVDAYTAVRYRMYLQPNEPIDKPFRFNEAGLFAMEYMWDTVNHVWIPSGNYIMFARFTTMDKYLESADGIMIEWYVLV